MAEQLGDRPIDERYREGMNRLARLLDTFFNTDAKGNVKQPREVGFVLIVFPFAEAEKARAGETGRANYISNADRADVVTMLKEQIKRFEGQPEMTGHA